MDMYVYYRVAASRADALQAQVGAMQAGLLRQYGVGGGLKRRPAEKDGQHTWMEIYLALPDGFDAIIERAVSQAELAALIEGERHVEYFVDVFPCA